MGSLLAKFRKEKTTTAALEALEEKIKAIEKYSINTQEQKKRFVGTFLVLSVVIYIIALFMLFFIYFPRRWSERVFYIIPMLLFPIVIIFSRKLFTWYFENKLNRNSIKLKQLHADKKKILDEVMDKETYKVAVKLLTRFGNIEGRSTLFGATPRVAPVATQSARPCYLNNTSSTPNLPSTAINLNDLTTPRPVVSMSSLTRNLALQPASNNSLTMHAPLRSPAQMALRKSTPYPIVNQQDKSVFERIVDVLVGDGPQDRFAMICKQCHAHNGMALKEDFEYTTFHCAFCNHLNPSRKTRPVAPRLSMNDPVPRITIKESDSDSSSDDISGSERESGLSRRLSRNPNYSNDLATPTASTYSRENFQFGTSRLTQSNDEEDLNKDLIEDGHNAKKSLVNELKKQK